MNYTYAGIGSRETPPDICKIMTEIAKRLAHLGLTLHSGGAEGADSAFERGAILRRKIFLPWDGFQGKFIDHKNKMHGEGSYLVPRYKESLVFKYHPGAKYLKQGAIVTGKQIGRAHV